MNIFLKILIPVLLPVSIFLFLPETSAAQTPAIVFVSRNLEQNGNIFYPQSGLLPGMGPFSRFKVVGGRLLVRESNGNLRVLIDSTMNFGGIHLFDFQSPCVFWDASKIVFSAVENRDSSWRIYEINSNGTGFRKITFTDRNINLFQFGPIAQKFVNYDDIDPCYLPDGRICFASTRYPALNEYTGARTTNIYIIKSDLSNVYRLTSERNGAEKPTINPIDGKIVYARYWLNIDMPSIITASGLTRDSMLALTKDVANVWQTASIRPDGNGLDMYSGTGNNRLGMMNYKPSITQDGKLLGVFVPHTPMGYTSGSPGIRWFAKGMDYPHYIAGVDQNNQQLFVQNPPSTGTMQPPYATDPVEMPDGKILFSYATQVVNQDYGLYTININGTGLSSFFDIPGKLELNAQILAARTVPPIIVDLVPDTSDDLPPTIDPGTYFKNGGFRFDCVNMFFNGDVDKPMEDAPPISKFARINFYLNFQRQDSLGRDSAIFFDSREVQFSGQINFDLAPADVSMFEQVTDSVGKVIHGATGQVAHVSGMNFGRPGTGTKCVGCHAGHTQITVPPNLSEGQYFNISTSASVTQSSFVFINDSNQFPGSRVIDRRAQNDSIAVNWIANGTNNEFVDLKWNIPIDIRRVKLYNIKSNPSTNTTIQVTDCEVFLYNQGSQVGHIASTGPITQTGTEFQIPGSPITIDEEKVIVKSFTGLVNGQNKAGLAEVETNARISYYDINGVHQISGIAEKFSLGQNYPNPFNPTTKIKYSIPASNSFAYSVKLVVYDITGREVKTLINQIQTRGSYEIDFNAANFASGIYFYKLTAGSDYSEVKKMVLLK